MGNSVTKSIAGNLIINTWTNMDNPGIVSGTLTDHEIIERVLQGERDLYALIVRRYNQRLYRVGMSVINDDMEVEDIMQATYIKAYENLGKFQFKSAFATWITRILINESLLRLKKRKQSMVISNDDMSKGMNQQFIRDEATPYSNTLNQELKHALEKAIHSLPDKYRTVFIMREIENMSIAETKACLDLTEVNIKVRLSRAKALLRNSLTDYYKKDDVLPFHLIRCDRMVENVMKHIS